MCEICNFAETFGAVLQAITEGTFVDIAAERRKAIADEPEHRETFDGLLTSMRETYTEEGPEVTYDRIMAMFREIGPELTAVSGAGAYMRLVRDGIPATED